MAPFASAVNRLQLAFFLPMAALGISLFYVGLSMIPFALALMAAVLWAALVVWRGGEDGLALPRGSLFFWLTGLCIWLALTVSWSAVPFTSAINAWAFGGAALMAGGYLLSDNRESLWQWLVPVLLLIGAALSVYAGLQYFAAGEQPAALFANKNSLAAYLNLFWPLAAARFLAAAPGRRLAKGRLLLLVALFAFVIGLIGSRGALLALLVILILLTWPLRRNLGWRPPAALAAALVCGLAAADLLAHGYLGLRFDSLLHPIASGTDRFLIWRGALNMLRHSPWYGRGIGTFWFAWPPFRLPADASAGFFAHNDYLQVFIEAGWPGLVLLLGVIAAAVRGWRRGMKAGNASLDQRIELAAVGAALAGVAFHSLFTFNFYILPILLVVGLLLGRLQTLAAELHGSVPLRIDAGRWLRPTLWRLLVATAVLIVLGYFAGMGGAYWFYQQGVAREARGDFFGADQDMTRACALWSGPDVFWAGRADVMRRAIRHLPTANQTGRRRLFEAAENCLKEATRRNPLRPKIYYERGLLLAENPEFAGPAGNAEVLKAFQQALVVDPLYLAARLQGALLLEKHGQLKAAHELLEAGIAYPYEQRGEFADYLALTARLRSATGDIAGAKVLERRLQTLKDKTPAVPERATAAEKKG